MTLFPDSLELRYGGTGMFRLLRPFLLLVAIFHGVAAEASYTNFESSQVHPIGLTPSGAKLLALNTPDAML